MTHECRVLLAALLFSASGPSHSQTTAIIPVIVPSDDLRALSAVTAVRPAFPAPDAASRAKELAQQAHQSIPEQRPVTRSEILARIQQTNAELVQFLRLDRQAAQQLFELLTEQELERRASSSAGAIAADELARTQRHDGQLRALLGAEVAQRYHHFQRIEPLQRRVIEFDARLGAGEKLRLDQQQSLLDLIEELELRFWRRALVERSFADRQDIASMLEGSALIRQQRAKLRSIDLNERSLRANVQAVAAARERVSQFLTPSQLDAYSRWQAEKLALRRQYLQMLRAAAAVPARLLEPMQQDSSNEVTLAGPVSLQFKIQINAQPATIAVSGESGAVIPFDINGELSAEARPTLFANGEVYVLLRFFERGQALTQPLAVIGIDSWMPAQLGRPQLPLRLRSETQAVAVHGSKYQQLVVDLETRPLSPPRDESTL